MRVIIYLLLVFKLQLGRVVRIVNLISTAIYYVNSFVDVREQSLSLCRITHSSRVARVQSVRRWATTRYY